MDRYTLHSAEQRIVMDADWLLAKNRIIEKVFYLFGALHVAMEGDVGVRGFPLPNAQSAKISKGEQYLGLPYVILDYPRLFGRDSIFACRTFFWWGRFFSITLHLAGEALEQYKSALVQAQERLAADHWHVCVQDDPWQHHFEADNYRTIASLTPEQWGSLLQKPFVKLAKRYDLSVWEKIIPYAVAGYASLLGMLKGEEQV